MTQAAATQATKTEAAPPPPDAETMEREKRLAAEKGIREKCKKLYEAFQSKEVGLKPMQAALLSAYVFTSVEKSEELSVKKAIEWGCDFRRTHPVLWGSLAQGNTMGFLKQLGRHGLDPEGLSDDYVRLGSIIGA